MNFVKRLFNLLIGQSFRLYLGGGGSGQQVNSTTNTSNIPEYARPYVENMLGATQNQLFNTRQVAGTDDTPGYTELTGFKPYQPYSTNPENYVAGFSPLQQQGFSSLANMQVAPQIGQGTGIANQASQGAMGTANPAMGYGMAGFNAGMSYGQNAQDPNAVAGYMNPYLQNTLNPAMQLLNQQYGQQSAQEQGAATSAGAFGGSRNALMGGLNQQNRMLAGNQLVGNAYNQAYNTANQNMQQAASLGMQGAQTGLAGIQSAQNAYGLGLQGANTLGNLANTQYNQEMGIAQAQLGAGAQQQNRQQQIINQGVQDYANSQQYPLMQLGTMSNMLRGLPMQSSTTNQYLAAPNPVTQGIGAAGSLAYMNSAMQPKTAAKGGIMQAFDVGGEVRANLENMSLQQLQQYMNQSSSPEVKRMAQELIRQKTMEQQFQEQQHQPVSQQYAKGGITEVQRFRTGPPKGEAVSVDETDKTNEPSFLSTFIDRLKASSNVITDPSYRSFVMEGGDNNGDISYEAYKESGGVSPVSTSNSNFSLPRIGKIKGKTSESVETPSLVETPSSVETPSEKSTSASKYGSMLEGFKKTVSGVPTDTSKFGAIQNKIVELGTPSPNAPVHESKYKSILDRIPESVTIPTGKAFRDVKTFFNKDVPSGFGNQSSISTIKPDSIPNRFVDVNNIPPQSSGIMQATPSTGVAERHINDQNVRLANTASAPYADSQVQSGIVDPNTLLDLEAGQDIVNPKSVSDYQATAPKTAGASQTTGAPKVISAPQGSKTGIANVPAGGMPGGMPSGPKEYSLSEAMKEIQDAKNEVGLGENKEAQAYRSKLMAERANLGDEAARQQKMRAAEFFATWGSTPGNTLVAGMQALKKTIPDLISDDREQAKARKEADKALYDLDQAIRAEKLGDFDKAAAFKEKAADRANQLNMKLIDYQGDLAKAGATVEAARIRELGDNARHKITEGRETRLHNEFIAKQKQLKDEADRRDLQINRKNFLESRKEVDQIDSRFNELRRSPLYTKWESDAKFADSKDPAIRKMGLDALANIKNEKDTHRREKANAIRLRNYYKSLAQIEDDDEETPPAPTANILDFEKKK